MPCSLRSRLRQLSPQQQQRLRSLIREPALQPRAEGSKGSDQQIRAIRPNATRGCLLRQGDHQLAHMPALGHLPEGLFATFHRKGRRGQRYKPLPLCILNQAQKALPQRLRIPCSHLQQIEAVINRVRAALLHLLIAPDLELAELDKAASLGESLETGVHPLALEAVQHHIRTAASGVLQNLAAKQRGT